MRASLDIRRYGVSTAPWHTFGIIGNNVPSHDGLLRSSKRAINEVEWHTQAYHTSDMTLPMLSHVDIYGRSMKITYVAGLQHTKIRQCMARHPFLFRVCHGYKMSVLRVYNAYQPLWTALEFTGFLSYSNAVSVLCAPDLILMERMILAVFRARPCLGNSLRRSNAARAWQVGKLAAAFEPAMGIKSEV